MKKENRMNIIIVDTPEKIKKLYDEFQNFLREDQFPENTFGVFYDPSDNNLEELQIFSDGDNFYFSPNTNTKLISSLSLGAATSIIFCKDKFKITINDLAILSKRILKKFEEKDKIEKEVIAEKALKINKPDEKYSYSITDIGSNILDKNCPKISLISENSNIIICFWPFKGIITLTNLLKNQFRGSNIDSLTTAAFETHTFLKELYYDNPAPVDSRLKENTKILN